MEMFSNIQEAGHMNTFNCKKMFGSNVFMLKLECTISTDKGLIQIKQNTIVHEIK